MATPAPFPLVAVAGPTASGKSGLALELALRFQGEILNCDSLQLYRGFDIGTAKLTPPERRGVPHHLLDILSPSEISTAGDFSHRARPCLEAVAARGHLPLVAGGTGFYLRALLNGLAPSPTRDESLRTRLAHAESLRPGILHRYLRRLDPTSAARIHPNDVNKLIRAIEISRLARQPAAQWFESQPPTPLQDFSSLKLILDPPRDTLASLIEARTRRMFAHGLVDEVQHLLNSGVPRTAKPFESLGYRHALAVLDGSLTLGEAIDRTIIETRQYAKRQRTWFRKESDAVTLSGFGHEVPILRLALEMTSRHLDKFAKFATKS